MRIDKYLHENKFAESRNKAQSMIASGIVYIGKTAVTKASFDYDPCCNEPVEIRGSEPAYVGRGGLKLEAALEYFKIDVGGMTAIDIGASTGGFTDCLLSRGAVKVFAIDSGKDQLHQKLLHDVRVTSMEGFNARELSEKTIGCRVDIAVMDVSFISQTMLHNNVASVLKKNGSFVTLIKPQFEVGRCNVGKGGIVKDKSLHEAAVNKVKESAAASGFVFMDVTVSPVRGKDGNTEYLAYFKYCER